MHRPTDRPTDRVHPIHVIQIRCTCPRCHAAMPHYVNSADSVRSGDSYKTENADNGKGKSMQRHPCIFLINFSDRHPYVAHYKQMSQCSTLPVSMTDNESSRVTFLSAIVCTATNMVATCRRMIELGQKKDHGNQED